jgi:hypothetical protein
VRISACPRCSSLDIRHATVSDGIVAGGGELLLSVCRDCGFRGAPAYFEDEAAVLRYREGLAQAGGPVDSAGAGDEQVPAEIREILDLPESRPSRVSAVLVGAIGLVAAGFGAVMLGIQVAALAILAFFAGNATASVLAVQSWYSLALAALALGIGVAFLRVARRMWTRPM